MKSSSILNVGLDSNVNKKNYREVFFKLLNLGNSKIFTINPEFIVDAFFDNSFRKVLNKGDLNTVDGFGIALVLKSRMRASKNTKDIVFTGVDLVSETLKIMNEEKLSLFLLGGSSEQNVSMLASKKIEKQYPNIRQESWIIRNSSKIPANISIGVGGTLDFLSGNVKRAPRFMRNLGLEWLYRLLIQPSRLPRILKAVILFPILVVFFENKKATKNSN